MKSYGKYISKHLAYFFLFVLALLLFNGIAFFSTFYGVISKDYGSDSPQKLLPVVAETCSIQGVPEETALRLRASHIWAMFLDSSGQLVWNVDLPEEIPDSFTIQDVALFSKGYLKDYPVFVRTMDDGLLVLGYPKDSYTKLTGNYFSIKVIKTAPFFCLALIIADLLLLFAAFLRSKKSILKSTEPIILSIESLAKGEAAHVNVKGELSEIAESVNHASLILSRQNQARANWISGVSHDIRTPLSMIMGYADRISGNPDTSERTREQAEIIKNQSSQIKDLISDLNLVSQLEYEMQPLKPEPVKISKLLRTYAADLLNSGLPEQYSLDIAISSEAENCMLKCDARLITRAVSNLVQNSMKHNPKGCHITMMLEYADSVLTLMIQDDGIGISTKKLMELEKPHYMESMDDRLDLRHGLGLLLVRQVVTAHDGKMHMQTLDSGGVLTIIDWKMK